MPSYNVIDREIYKFQYMILTNDQKFDNKFDKSLFAKLWCSTALNLKPGVCFTNID